MATPSTRAARAQKRMREDGTDEEEDNAAAAMTTDMQSVKDSLTRLEEKNSLLESKIEAVEQQCELATHHLEEQEESRVQEIRDILAEMGLEDANGEGGLARAKFDRNKKVSQLIQFLFHDLVKRQSRTFRQWPGKQVVESDPGIVIHWPKPVGQSPGLQELTCSEILQCDLEWEGGEPEQTRSATDPEKKLTVWRPDWLNDKSQSAKAFKAEVKKQAKQILGEPFPVEQEAALNHHLKTYWKNVQRAYQRQNNKDKADDYVGETGKNRRRGRKTRVSWVKKANKHETLLTLRGYRYEGTDLTISTHHRWQTILRLADSDWRCVETTWQYQITCQTMKREDLLSARIFMSGSIITANIPDVQLYKKDQALELRDLFFITHDLRLASIVLGEHLRQKKRGTLKPTFRGPIECWLKDWEAPIWPKIKPVDDSNKQGKDEVRGSVVYHFMVDHAYCEKLPAYPERLPTLWPDPDITIDNLESAASSQSFEDDMLDEEKYPGLWQAVRRVYEGQVTHRPDEATLLAAEGDYDKILKSQSTQSRRIRRMEL